MAGTVDAIATFRFTGTVTHLGCIDGVATHCSDQDTGQYGDGQATLTAANGDMLFATYTGGSSDVAGFPVVGFMDTFTITGGTGRFANASGGGTESGTFNVETMEFTLQHPAQLANIVPLGARTGFGGPGARLPGDSCDASDGTDSVQGSGRGALSGLIEH